MSKKPKYQIKKRTPFDNNLLPVIQNLAAEQRSLADIGMLLGYAGKNPEKWIRYLKSKYPEVADALTAGARMADVKLIVTAFDAATGYDVEEEIIDYKNLPERKVDGQTIPATTVELGKKVKIKHILPDTTLLFKLLCNRLPEYFSDTKKVEIDKRSVDMEIDMNKEIASFAGKLMEAAQYRKKVESKEVENKPI